MRQVGGLLVLAALLAALACFPAHATTIVYLGDDPLIDDAERIVHGTVVDKTVHLTEDGGKIYTEYRIRVHELLKGEPTSEAPDGSTEVVFREWGGRHQSGVSCWIPGRGELDFGEEVVVLLGPTDPETGVGFTSGLALGKLHVQRGERGAQVTRSVRGLDTVDRDGQKVAPPDEVCSLEDWKRRIRERVARQGAR